VVDESGLRLVAPAHIAPTRDQAIAEIADGFARWDRHMREVAEGGGEIDDSRFEPVGSLERNNFARADAEVEQGARQCLAR